MAKEIRIQNVSVTVTSEQQTILNGLQFTLEPGYIYGIIGPNGAGKTTLLRHILDFETPSEGEIFLGEIPVRKYGRKKLARELAFVPQNVAMDTDFTAIDVVLTGRNPYQKRFAGVTVEDKKIAEEALEFTGSMELSQKAFRTLSGGEAQRVLISRAIAQQTPWLLLDEPVASMDICHQIQLMENLRKLNWEKNTSVLMVLHDINLASVYCDRIVMLKEGQLFSKGFTEEIMTEERLEALYGIPFLKLHHQNTGNVYFFPVGKKNKDFPNRGEHGIL